MTSKIEQETKVWELKVLQSVSCIPVAISPGGAGHGCDRCKRVKLVGFIFRCTTLHFFNIFVCSRAKKKTGCYGVLSSTWRKKVMRGQSRAGGVRRRFWTYLAIFAKLKLLKMRFGVYKQYAKVFQGWQNYDKDLRRLRRSSSSGIWSGFQDIDGNVFHKP